MTAHAVEHKLDERARAANALVDTLRDLGISDDDRLVLDTVEGETDLFEVIDAALTEIDGCEVIIEGCKAKEADIKARRDRATDRREKVRAAIEQAIMIADIPTKIVRPTATLTLIKRAPGVVVDDEAKIPSEFFVPQPPKLDKKALADAASERPIEGCHMDNGSVSLTIRRK